MNKEGKIIHCDYCGELIYKYPSQLNVGSHYCNNKCRGKGSLKYAKYTDRQLILILQEMARVLGHVPTRDSFIVKEEWPSYSTYIRHFGTWTNALERAGFILHGRGELGHKPTWVKDSKIYSLNLEQRAYLAAAIDGEGCIQIPERRQIGINITQANRKWLEDIQKMTGGGTIYEHGGRQPRSCWQLNFSKYESIDILRQVLDYLYIKKVKALEVLAVVDLEPYCWVL